MEAKEPSDKAGPHLHLKASMTATEEIHNVSTDNEDMHMGRDLVYFVLAVNSNGDAAEKSREGRASEGRSRTAMGESGKVAKIKDVSSERRRGSSIPSHSQFHVQG